MDSYPMPEQCAVLRQCASADSELVGKEKASEPASAQLVNGDS